eukprot:gene4260-5330_t
MSCTTIYTPSTSSAPATTSTSGCSSKYMNLFQNADDLIENLHKHIQPITPYMTPETDIQETNESIFIDIELPGVSKENISINYKDAHLIIDAKKHLIKSSSNSLRKLEEIIIEEIIPETNLIDIPRGNIDTTKTLDTYIIIYSNSNADQQLTIEELLNNGHFSLLIDLRGESKYTEDNENKQILKGLEIHLIVPRSLTQYVDIDIRRRVIDTQSKRILYWKFLGKSNIPSTDLHQFRIWLYQQFSFLSLPWPMEFTTKTLSHLLSSKETSKLSLKKRERPSSSSNISIQQQPQPQPPKQIELPPKEESVVVVEEETFGYPFIKDINQLLLSTTYYYTPTATITDLDCDPSSSSSSFSSTTTTTTTISNSTTTKN